MQRASVLRCTLWISCPFNLGAAYVLAFPGSALGQLAGLPASVPVAYRALTAFLIALFGLAYGWLASQPRIDKPLLTISALGKSGVFIIVSLLWLAGHVSAILVMLAFGDLILAACWFYWLCFIARIIHESKTRS